MPAAVPLTLIVIEGFGRVPMAAKAWELLAAYDGRKWPWTAPRACATAWPGPEIIVPLPRAAGVAPYETTAPAIGVRALVRLIAPPYLGQIGRVLSDLAGQATRAVGPQHQRRRGAIAGRGHRLGAAGRPGGIGVAMRVSTTQLQQMKKRGERIAMITCLRLQHRAPGGRCRHPDRAGRRLAGHGHARLRIDHPGDDGR